MGGKIINTYSTVELRVSLVNTENNSTSRNNNQVNIRMGGLVGYTMRASEEVKNSFSTSKLYISNNKTSFINTTISVRYLIGAIQEGGTSVQSTDKLYRNNISGQVYQVHHNVNPANENYNNFSNGTTSLNPTEIIDLSTPNQSPLTNNFYNGTWLQHTDNLNWDESIWNFSPTNIAFPTLK